MSVYIQRLFPTAEEYPIQAAYNVHLLDLSWQLTVVSVMVFTTLNDTFNNFQIVVRTLCGLSKATQNPRTLNINSSQLTTLSLNCQNFCPTSRGCLSLFAVLCSVK